MSKGKIAIGAVLGAMAGVIAGVLTAPKSGKETRADLKSKANELKKDAARRAEDATSKTSEAVSDLKERGEHVVQGVKKEFYDKR